MIGVYYQINSIPELCLGGLIGYFSKDYLHTTGDTEIPSMTTTVTNETEDNEEINEYTEQ